MAVLDVGVYFIPLKYTLYDTASGGPVIGPTVTVTCDGLFTATDTPGERSKIAVPVVPDPPVLFGVILIVCVILSVLTPLVIIIVFDV
jgi:hypothetical protein